MKQSVVAEKQEGRVTQYTKFDILDAQLQPVLPGFTRKKVPYFAQLNAQELHDKLAEKVDANIMVSRRNQGFGDLERLCDMVISESNPVITGFVIAERDNCVQFCCLVDGRSKSFPLRRNLTAVCD